MTKNGKQNAQQKKRKEEKRKVSKWQCQITA